MLKITTPNTQQIDGNARLDSYNFTGKYDRKFFTLENTGASAQNLTFSIGSTGMPGFRIFPSDNSLQNTLTLSLNSNDKISFSVDYKADWGGLTSVGLTSSENIYTGSTYDTVLIGPTISMTFKTTTNAIISKREIGSLLCKDKNKNHQVSQGGTKITEDETSFGLVRTNPKLTGNVKITVDSAQEIWLNSIDAVKELSDDKYKKYRIGKQSSYAIDVNRFFDYGTTPPELVYSLYQADTQYTSTKRTLDQQYDRFYQYGATSLKDKFYDEDFAFFAPLYLKTSIPDYFVIFRTNGAINKFSYDTASDQWPLEINSQILTDSQIIKVYDLSEKSSIGTYLRNITGHPSRTESDITISHQENGYTTFNGISYVNGSFANMGERLYDYYSEENPLISSEEFITLGFERNKVFSSHVINLEFLFNDDTAENYTINRYFGLYVNAVDLATFNMSGEGLQEFSLELNQLPLPRKNVDGNKLSLKSFTQTNANGISIFAETPSIERVLTIDKETIFTSIVDTLTYDASFIYVTLSGNFTNSLVVNNLFSISGPGLTSSSAILNFSYLDDITSIVLDRTTLIGATVSYLISDATLDSLILLGSNAVCDFYNEQTYIDFTEKIFDNRFINNQPRFFYVKDNINNLHSVKNTEFKYFVNNDVSERTLEIKLKDVSFDISKLGGFSTLMTQTPAVSMDTLGKAGLSVEILNFLKPNDYFEISWPTGSTSVSGYPLRWRAVANSSFTNPGESWPSYAIKTDLDGDYYLSYFNPGNSTILIKDLVKSIENAFNIFPFKDFEILARDNSLHFKSTQEGKISENATFKFHNSIPSLSIMGVESPAIGEVKFIGGTNRKNTRAKISTEIAYGILETEYVSTKGHFSAITSHQIIDNIILFSPYLDEPIYDDAGVLVDFKWIDDYKIITLDDENYQIQLTSDKQLTTYELFKPSFGLLSVMPLRDFDMDFFYSDYTKNYMPELKEYFGSLSPTIITSISGSDVCTFDKEFSFESYPKSVPYLIVTTNSVPILHNKDSQFVFNGPGATAQFVQTSSTITSDIITEGTTVLFMPNEKHMYFSDSEISKFKGFLSLSGVTSAQDEEEFRLLENKWDPTRFSFQLLNSEYDRLEENYLKTLAIKSRVVPYINKWVSPQGKDIRDNPYRFNYHRSFGNMNFSPSEDMNIPDPKYHTHEWPYLDSIPDKFPLADFPEYAFSYMFEELSAKYDFTSTSRDWFSEYFTTGYPTEKFMDTNGDFVSAKLDPTEKYAYFNYQTYDDTTTAFFRGYRFAIQELDSNNVPIVASTKYDNYRFSVIINSIEDDSFLYSDPISFKTIVNEKWKFILLKITVKTSSYRYTEGNLGYVDLYTLSNNDEIANYLYDPNYSTLLTGFSEAIPTDRKISVPLNFGFANTLLGPLYYNAFRSNTFTENLIEEIVPLVDGNYSRMLGSYESGSYNKTLISLDKVSQVYSKETLELSNNIGVLKSAALPFSIPLTLPSSSTSWINFTFYHQSGGNLSFNGVRNRLSFSEILKVMNGTSTNAKMTYEIYSINSTTPITVPNYTIKSISPDALTRIYDYFPVIDTDKPQEFYTIPEIGVVLEQQKDLQTLYRYQGAFSPKFRDVLKFWLREDEDFTTTISRDLLLTNTHLGVELKDFSLLKNQYYAKVSDKEILRLSQDSGYQPVYPIIDEVVIDKKSQFAWSSSWDQAYYRKYSSVNEYEELKGTLEMTEVKSLLGSKAMKIPGQYDLYQYEITQAPSSNLSAYVNNEFTYFEDATTAYIQVDVYDRLLREMLGTETDVRAKTEFLNANSIVPDAFDPLLIDDYVKQYLVDNIIELFDISRINLYILQTGNSGSNHISTVTPIKEQRPLIESIDGYTLSETELLARNYILKSDVKITNIGNLKFQIKYSLDSRFYTSLSVGVAVKRI